MRLPRGSDVEQMCALHVFSLHATIDPYVLYIHWTITPEHITPSMCHSFADASEGYTYIPTYVSVKMNGKCHLRRNMHTYILTMAWEEIILLPLVCSVWGILSETYVCV